MPGRREDDKKIFYENKLNNYLPPSRLTGNKEIV
jgi:hypothetical protein